MKSKLRFKTFKGNTSNGFTLLEVLVALVIIAIGLAALFTALSQGTRLTSRVEERMVGHWVASNQLTQFRALSIWPKPENKELEVEMAGRNWFVQQNVSATRDKNIRRVDVTVSLDKEANYTVANLYGFFFNPKSVLFDEEN